MGRLSPSVNHYTKLIPIALKLGGILNRLSLRLVEETTETQRTQRLIALIQVKLIILNPVIKD